MYSKVISSVSSGIEGLMVSIETHITGGLPLYRIVGLPGAVVRESQVRVRSAIRSSGLRYPDDRVTQNLYPEYERKEGAQLDLPLAMGIVAAMENRRCDDMAFLGELSLDGSIKRICSIFAHLEALRAKGMRRVVVPDANKSEAMNIEGMELSFHTSLEALIMSWKEGSLAFETSRPHAPLEDVREAGLPDFSDVVGQEKAIRALTVAAVGGHSVLLVGPPGCGKSMLAERFVGILPPPDTEERIAIRKIRDHAGESAMPDCAGRPVRIPHHSITATSLIGGGSPIRAGEVTKAHLGVLLLDELGEYKKHVIETLREPMSMKSVVISKGARSIQFPADFHLLATMNPCGCGRMESGDDRQQCVCTDHDIRSYYRKLSQPIIDRLDILVRMSAVDPRLRLRRQPARTTRSIQEEVVRAKRFKEDVATPAIERAAPEALDAALNIQRQKNLSMRGFNKLLEVSDSIASLAQSRTIERSHVFEADSYSPSAYFRGRLR